MVLGNTGARVHAGVRGCSSEEFAARERASECSLKEVGIRTHEWSRNPTGALGIKLVSYGAMMLRQGDWSGELFWSLPINPCYQKKAKIYKHIEVNTQRQQQKKTLEYLRMTFSPYLPLLFLSLSPYKHIYIWIRFEVRNFEPFLVENKSELLEKLNHAIE